MTVRRECIRKVILRITFLRCIRRQERWKMIRRFLNNTVTDVRTYTASDDRNVKSADGKGYHYPSSNREATCIGKERDFCFQKLSRS